MTEKPKSARHVASVRVRWDRPGAREAQSQKMRAVYAAAKKAMGPKTKRKEGTNDQ